MSEGQKVERRREKPTLVVTGEGRKKIIRTSHGHWNDILIADYLITQIGIGPVTVGELAKIGFNGLNSKDTRTKARRYLSKVRVLLGDRGHILLYQIEGRRIEAVRIAQLDNDNDRIAARQVVDSMERRGELSAERAERFKRIVDPA
jgi:hypothetical protein